MRDMGMQRGQPGGSELHDKEISEFRFTVHPTPNMEEHNRINFHRILKNGRSETVSASTSAIKKSDDFAFLYLSRESAYPHKNVNIDMNDKKTICLDVMDNRLFTLVYAVFVSRKGLELGPVPGDVNKNHVDLGNFRFTFLWSFFPMVSPPGNVYVTYYDSEGDIYRDQMDINPVNRDLALQIFFGLARESYEELVKYSLSHMTFRSHKDELITKAFYKLCNTLMKRPNPISKEYLAHEFKANFLRKLNKGSSIFWRSYE